MTLIECFTAADIDNIASCLRLRPAKMILVGKCKEMARPIKRYKALLEKRKQKTKVVPCNIEHKSFRDICDALYKVLLEEKKCVIDVTGGDETVLLAVGAVLAQLNEEKRKNVRVEKYEHDRGVVVDCIGNKHYSRSRAVKLTVEELILLHGGCIYPDSYQPPETYQYTDMEEIWHISKDWNDAISKLLEFESRSEDSMKIDVSWAELRSGISNFAAKEPIVVDLLDRLQRKGMIDDYSNFYTMQYRYRTEELRYCTAKAGNALEMKTLLEGRAVTENGRPYFDDCRMSVSIDWDGVVHTPRNGQADTNNEIDVVLMRGTTPLFVSCKNGDVNEEELYKLNTVAARFGGKYVRKMLVSTNFNKGKAFIQRAGDMGIYLVTDVKDMTHEQWQALFLEAMQ